MPNHGVFSGNPITEWIVDPSGRDRDMRLLEDFSYTDKTGRVWLAPQGSIINGASIPRALWSTVGSPYAGDYRRASVVHDVACNSPDISREEADEMFYSACLAGGCTLQEARILYVGVRIGAWASTWLPTSALPKKWYIQLKDHELATPESLYLQHKLVDILKEIEALPEDSPLSDMNNVISRYLKN